ncbi:E3 ubiquitin-protein ligase RBBP6-like [Halyomorpha halys]|uniref:E3 ubiquitin-protein ligase RBBP6-like n=1 Tax=Halyomorpha halys TaxID=286706 RepID=UPI0006D5059D
MSVHYKFKSALSFDTITFDGLHISVRDLKKAILQQKQIGKATDFDLQITNAQSNEVYDDENVLIPKNSSLIVVRIPLTAQQKKSWEKADTLPSLNTKQIISPDAQDILVNRLAKYLFVDLIDVYGGHIGIYVTFVVLTSNIYIVTVYLRIKGSNQVGELPANYRCYKCLQPGHWIKDCKLNAQQERKLLAETLGDMRTFWFGIN